MPIAPLPLRAGPLDRAIVASVAAMLAMNVAALSQQFHAGPVTAPATASAPHPVTIA